MNLVEYIKCNVVEEGEECVLLPQESEKEGKLHEKDVYYFQSNKRSVISENEQVMKTKLGKKKTYSTVDFLCLMLFLSLLFQYLQLKSGREEKRRDVLKGTMPVSCAEQGLCPGRI